MLLTAVTAATGPTFATTSPISTTTATTKPTATTTTTKLTATTKLAGGYIGDRPVSPDGSVAQETMDGELFAWVRAERRPVAVGEPPERDTPWVIGATGLEHLDDDRLLSRLERITALEAMLAAEKAATLAGFAARVSGTSADLGHEHPRQGDRPAIGAERRWHDGLLRSVADETGLALGLQRRAASRRINASINLVTRFPATLKQLSAGRLPERAAFAIAAELSCIPDPALRRQVEHHVLNWVDRYGPHRAKQVARREAAKHTADHDTLSYELRLDERAVTMRPVDAGIAELAITTSALQTAAVMTSLSSAALAARRHGDGRTLDQLRTDIAIARLLGRSPTVAASADPNRGQRAAFDSDDEPRVCADVVIHCTAAEAVAVSTGEAATGGDLDGYGPLPQPALADALRTAKIRYRLTDAEPVGDPDRYTPSAALTRHVVDRDRRCRIRGCNQPAMRCDIDHRVPYPHGTTTADNCHALCRHHHRLKHRGGWKLLRLPTGELRWTSPTGRHYLLPKPDD